MTFQKEPRYWVRRRVGTRFAYLTSKGEQTLAPKDFGERWSKGEPAKFTLNEAIKNRDDANAQVITGERFGYVPVGGSYNT